MVGSTFTWGGTGWQGYTKTFTYNGNTGNSFMRIDYLGFSNILSDGVEFQSEIIVDTHVSEYCWGPFRSYFTTAPPSTFIGSVSLPLPSAAGGKKRYDLALIEIRPI